MYLDRNAGYPREIDAGRDSGRPSLDDQAGDRITHLPGMLKRPVDHRGVYRSAPSCKWRRCSANGRHWLSECTAAISVRLYQIHECGDHGNPSPGPSWLTIKGSPTCLEEGAKVLSRLGVMA